MTDEDSPGSTLDEWNRAEISWQKRLAYLEEVAEQFWPGTDWETKEFRTAIVWQQFSRELDWEAFKEMEPAHEPAPIGPDDLIDAFTIPGISSLGPEAVGFGDHLRAELKRQGSDLDSFCDAMKPAKEEIPWDEVYPKKRLDPKQKARWLRQRRLLGKKYKWNS